MSGRESVRYGTTPGGKVRHMLWGEQTGKCGRPAPGPDNPALQTCQRCRESYAALAAREQRRARWR
ncbi:hypothetical protein Strvi_0075 (plasmid) [Streptomyces violaceusniger Tu 4113]|uniref:Uncharacterized protein n=1 Tax=Streptomyces violaceusniger (strain Tu 4113) TaxID=653045 RepID=G2PHQ0_STRV4|nr:hypothetical protein Strvi_0075 [Streptomyces violaceusniger Tu 4113]